MEKLKTLEDLKFETEFIDCRELEEETDLTSGIIILSEDLKQEAIKLIKEINKKCCFTLSDFMRFHNITVEDLK